MTSIRPVRWRRLLVIVVAALAGLSIAGLLAMHIAARMVRTEVVRLLGPSGHAARIDVGLTRVTLDQVVIRAPAGWPAQDAMRARRLVLEPSWSQLLSHRLTIRSATAEEPYLSIVRSRDGKISLLPDIGRSMNDSNTTAEGKKRETGTRPDDPATFVVDVEKIMLNHGTLDFFDATVAQPPARLQMDSLTTRIGPLHFPALAERTQVEIAGNIVGPSNRGPMNIDGWIVFANQSSDIRMRFAQVDVKALRPYLQKGTVSLIESGWIGIDMHSVIHARKLQANGHITLDGLELASGNGPLALLTHIPREAAIAALKNRQNRIALDFTLQGDLSDPTFSLNEGIVTRLAAGMAKTLGVSAEGVARSVGETTRGLGGALMNLIGK